MQALAEAIALGSTLELPRDLLFDTLAKTAVVAPAHSGKLATAKKHDYAPQFPVRLMRKDFGLVLAAAAKAGLSMPATEAAAEINYAEAAPGTEEDFSAVIRRMERSVRSRKRPATSGLRIGAPMRLDLLLFTSFLASAFFAYDARRVASTACIYLRRLEK